MVAEEERREFVDRSNRQSRRNLLRHTDATMIAVAAGADAQMEHDAAVCVVKFRTKMMKMTTSACAGVDAG